MLEKLLMAIIRRNPNPAPIVIEEWTPLDFGKYEGKTLPQVIFNDPDWFFWAYEDGVFKDKGEGLRSEATNIYRRATRIRIRPRGTEIMVVEYRFDRLQSNFLNFEIVPANQAPHSGATATERQNTIDLSYPRRKKIFDKDAYANFLAQLKQHLFEDSSHRMTKNRCEEFFRNNDNFVF